MEEDFVKAQGYIGLAVRLKRISDTMMHGARQLYRTLGLDIEPNWYLIFKLLDQHESMPVTVIAERLRFSHPSVISIIRKMKERGYLRTSQDPVDSRKQLVMLTGRSKQMLPKLEEVWSACGRGIQTIFLPDDQFFDQLEVIEQFYAEEDFMQRTLKEIENDK